MSIYFVDGKRIDTADLVEIYSHGTQSRRLVYFWRTKDRKRFFVEIRTQWQGEYDKIAEVYREVMIDALKEALYPISSEEVLKLMEAEGYVE